MNSRFKNIFRSFFKEKIVFLASLAIVIYFPIVSTAATSCLKEKKEFREIYLALQQQLNYEGKDAYLENGVLKLKNHDSSKPYEGKIFEEALYKEYQNSLRKVAKLYQIAKYDKDDKAPYKNSGLVEFIKSIDTDDNKKYIENNNIDTVIEELFKSSNSKFTDESNKKYALNLNDKYLLKKLLTHAQDRLCSVEQYEKTGKGTKLFDANYLKQVRNAPLNRLISTLKNAKIGAESDIQYADTPTAINSAIQDNLTKLSDWMKKNANCRKAIDNPIFIQNNIQGCNYRKFLDSLTLSDTNERNLRSVLDYINANEKLLNRPQAKAETALDELKLEAYIDQTFSNLSDKISCTQINGKGNTKRLFVRNLPYNNSTNKFDTSKITCKVKNKELSEKECSSKIEFVSDELGRGLEVRQKTKTGATILFSIKGNADCQDVGLSNSSNLPPVIPPGPELPPEIPGSPPELPPVAPPVTLPNDASDKDKCEKQENAGNLIISWDTATRCCIKKNPEDGKEVDKKCSAISGKDACLAQNKPGEEFFEWKKAKEDSESESCIDKRNSCKENESWDKTKNSCGPKAEDKCLVSEDGRPLSAKEIKECKNGNKEDAPLRDTEESQKAPIEYAPKSPPARFVPINIPTRQVYFLPGMP